MSRFAGERGAFQRFMQLHTQAEAVSGSMTISLPENAGFAADVDSVSGKVGGSLPVESRGDGRYTYGDEQCSIDIDTVSGNVWFNEID